MGPLRVLASSPPPRSPLRWAAPLLLACVACGGGSLLPVGPDRRVRVNLGARAGDEIQVRPWDRASWLSVPSPNAGSAGPARALAVAPGPVVAWPDADGAVRVRQGNL